MLIGWTGATTPALRDRVLDHAATCSVCGPNLPRSVSPVRVFALLPAPALSSAARLEILEFFDDSRKAAYREFTVSRAGEASPRLPRPAAAPRPARRRPRVSRVGVAAVASVAVTAVVALVGFHVTSSASTGGAPSAAAEGPGSAVNAPTGAADTALPVKVKRSPGGWSSARPLLQSAANKTESLAVTAASQPGTSSPSPAARPGTRAFSSSSSASPSASSHANGSLAVSPARLDPGPRHDR
jgi:hypothetical protein